MDVHAQAGAGNKLPRKDSVYLDSVKNSGYPWRFPIWGDKVKKRGFNIPYPVGVGLNPYIGSQLINISDLKVGFNDQEPVPFDFIKFGEVKATLQSVNTRLDLWVLPFLNVYGILGGVWAKTHVNVVEPIQFSTTADFKGYTYGLGTTIAGGYHGIVSINDINHTWTSMDKIEGKVKTWMITPRLGYNFMFPNKKDQTITVWVGTTGFFVNRTTEGSIYIGDLKHNIPEDKLQAIKDEVEDWYQDLTPAQKVVTKQIAQALYDRFNGVATDLTVNYSLKKEATSKWSLLVGGQFQFNQRWQIRAEFGFLGGRKSGLLSTNYRWRW